MKKSSSLAPSAANEGQAPPAASAVTDGADDDDYWDWEGAVRLDNVKWFGAKRHLRDFKDSCRVKKRNVTGTVVEAFELATEFVNQEAPACAGSSAQLVPEKHALATAQVVAKEAKKQLASLQQNHDILEGNLLSGFSKAQAIRKEEAEALRKQSLKAENNLDQIRITEAGRVE